jgi:hypothetical protein
MGSDDESLEFNEDEFLYEFLERKPVVKTLYAVSVVAACIFGLIANSLIIYVKLRNFRNRGTFDLLIANIAFGLNLLSLRFILIMIEETTHDVVILPMCYAARLAVDTATPIAITSLVTMMILIKYNPNVSKETELKIVSAILIYAAIIAIPVYDMTVIEYTSYKLPHKICVLHFLNDKGHTKYLIRLWISVAFKIFIPMAVAIVFFISLRFNFVVGQYKKYWIYAIIVSIFYFVFTTASILTPLVSIHFNVDIGSRLLVYVSFNILCFVVALSPAVLWVFDRDFYEEIVEFLRAKLQRSDADSNGEFNEIIFNEKDMHNVDIA